MSVDVEEFTDDLESVVQEFKVYWEDRISTNPEAYDTYLSPEEWEEQFVVFLRMRRESM